jgi:hypothetical protein
LRSQAFRDACNQEDSDSSQEDYRPTETQQARQAQQQISTVFGQLIEVHQERQGTQEPSQGSLDRDQDEQLDWDPQVTVDLPSAHLEQQLIEDHQTAERNPNHLPKPQSEQREPQISKFHKELLEAHHTFQSRTHKGKERPAVSKQGYSERAKPSSTGPLGQIYELEQLRVRGKIHRQLTSGETAIREPIIVSDVERARVSLDQLQKSIAEQKRTLRSSA